MLKLKKLMNAKGFTLVELLIVIAVIGILAIAVLAALDPIEQLRKSRDTGRLADARELVGSYQRFYASKGCHPKEWTAGTGCATTSPLVPAVLANGGQPQTDMTEMVTEGELKTTFPRKPGLALLFAGIDADAVPVVCFEPESRNMRMLPDSQRYSLTAASSSIAVAGAACPATYGGGTAAVANCMICVQ